MPRLDHDVKIDTRYGETTRECFCSATGGRSHAEWDSPWLEKSEEAALSEETRAERREAWRLHEFLEDHSDDLLDLIPRRTCPDHESTPGRIHAITGDQGVAICIPSEG